MQLDPIKIELKYVKLKNSQEWNDFFDSPKEIIHYLFNSWINFTFADIKLFN